MAAQAAIAGALVTAASSPALSQQLPLPTAPEVAAEPFEPRVDRTEADADRIKATALFGEGRLHYRHDEFEKALPKYQRAYRYSGGSRTILDEIVPLAFRMGRIDEALRYVALIDDESRIDPFVLRRLAIFLTERDEFAAALQLYKLSAQHNVESDGQSPAGTEIITDFEIGRLSFLVEDYEQAADRFARVMKVVDQDNVKGQSKIAVDALMKEASATLALIAEAYAGAGRLDDAEKLFRRALTEPSQAAMLRYQLARIGLERGDFDEANAELQKYFASGSEEAGTAPYELLEELSKKLNEQDSLIEQLTGLYKEQPKDLFVGYYLAQKLLESGKSQQAIPIFESLIAQRPLLDAYRGLLTAYAKTDRPARFCLLLTDAVGKLDGIAELEATLKQIVATDEAFLAAVVKEAEAGYLSGDVTEPKRRAVARAMAHLSLLRKDYDASNEYFEIAVGKVKPDTNVWLSWAIEQMISDRFDEATENLKQLAKEKLPAADAGTVQYYLAGALALDDDGTAGSIEAAEEAARKLPDVPSIQLRTPWALMLGKRWPAARRTYVEFLDKWSGEYGASSVREAVKEAKSSLSAVELELGDAQAAEEWLEQVLDEFPADTGTMNDLGYLWADRGVHLEKALAMIQRATQDAPENFAYRDSLGWVLFRLGRVDEAAVQLRRAVDVEDPDGVVLDHLGDVLAVAEGPQAAQEYWQRAFDLLVDSDPDLAAKIKRKLDSSDAAE